MQVGNFSNVLSHVLRLIEINESHIVLTGIETLISTLKDMTYLPNRKGDGELVFNVDHCFSIKGQGTVLTGTILQGIVRINDVSW